MSLSIKRIIQVDQNEWVSVWNNCEWSTFYESVEWFTIWGEFLNVGTHYMAFRYEFSDGISCIIPHLSRKVLRGLQILVEISPGGLYGGPISVQHLSQNHLNLLLLHLSSKYVNLEFRQNPYIDPMVGNSENDSHSFTQTLNLLLDENQAKKAFNKYKVAYDARLAIKNGLQIRIADPDDLTKFNQIYTKAKSRWVDSTSSYSIDFFRSLAKSEMSDYWGIYNLKDDFIGGGIMVKGKNCVSSWLAIMDEEHLRFRPYEFYYHQLYWHYRANGYHWLDLNPSGGHSGVVDFKNKFNPTHLKVNSLSKRSKFVEISEALTKLIK